MQNTMLHHTLDRSRWFVVPAATVLPDGDLPIRSFSRVERSVDPDALGPYEVDVAAARKWVDERFRNAFGKAGDAFGRLASRVRAAGRRQGRTVPDLSAYRIAPEDLLDVSPGELYTDPTRTREAVDALFAWASDRLRPPGEPAEPPDVGKTLAAVGAGLRKAAEQIAARREEAEARRARPSPTKLLRVGFYAELRHGDPQGQSLAAQSREQPTPHEAEIVRYLRAAPVLVASPGPVGDVRDPAAGFVGTRSIHTDGVWCWPGDLAYYVGRYHLALPATFLEHLLARGWDPGSPDLATVVF